MRVLNLLLIVVGIFFIGVIAVFIFGRVYKQATLVDIKPKVQTATTSGDLNNASASATVTASPSAKVSPTKR